MRPHPDDQGLIRPRQTRGSADVFVAQLHDLCRAEPTRAKWVFVPGHGLGHTLGERLALEGTSWANLRFTPPLELALQMAGPFFGSRRHGLSSASWCID